MRKLRRFAIATGCLTTALIATLLLAIYTVQGRLLFHPAPYSQGDLAQLPENAVRLEYETGQGRQTAFYVPPAKGSASPPEALWVMFHGNASLALDWLWVTPRAPSPEAGFLLIDYPGYGLCEGTPWPSTINESSEKAFATLASHLGVTTADLERNLGVAGVSMGSGAGLEFAARHPVRRVVLACPFTSLADAARNRLGPVGGWLLRENFDNRERLRELSARPDPPEVEIHHGTNDGITPFAMGEELARLFPDMVRFHRHPGRGHVVFLDEDGPVQSLWLTKKPTME